MGNNSSHKRTKVPKQAHKEKPPDMDKARRKRHFFSHLKGKKPNTKIVPLFPRDQRQQLAEATAGPGARPERASEAVADSPAGAPAAAPMLRGAGDGAKPRELKTLLVPLLLLDARLQEEGRGAAGGPGGGASAAQGRPRLYTRLQTESQAPGEAPAAEEQPRKLRRCPRPRP